MCYYIALDTCWDFLSEVFGPHGKLRELLERSRDGWMNQEGHRWGWVSVFVTVHACRVLLLSGLGQQRGDICDMVFGLATIAKALKY